MSARVLPVGAFVCLFQELLEADPLYSDLWVEGELTDFSRSAAGHVYFNLRDDDGCLKCVLFREQALRQQHLPAAGTQIIAHGGISIYRRSGSVQLQADLVRPAGPGAAALELEYLRQRLEAEGLFDPSRKRSLPAWPRSIGVVTSLHGAAWHDIQTVIGRRFPLAELVLAPAQVQGDGAPESIASAIESLQQDARVEVVIVARGGGASDDLSAFNDERVVRAVFACRIPVVTGIGHAIDRALVEDVADVAAPTPSVAAELSVPSRGDLAERLRSLDSRLSRSWAVRRAHAESAWLSAGRRLLANHPHMTLDRRQAALHAALDRLQFATDQYFVRRRTELGSSTALLAALDPNAILRRGYASLHMAEDDSPLFRVSAVQPGTPIVARLEDGSLTASVVATHPQAPAPGS